MSIICIFVLLHVFMALAQQPQAQFGGALLSQGQGSASNDNADGSLVAGTTNDNAQQLSQGSPPLGPFSSSPPNGQFPIASQGQPQQFQPFNPNVGAQESQPIFPTQNRRPFNAGQFPGDSQLGQSLQSSFPQFGQQPQSSLVPGPPPAFQQIPFLPQIQPQQLNPDGNVPEGQQPLRNFILPPFANVPAPQQFPPTFGNPSTQNRRQNVGQSNGASNGTPVQDFGPPPPQGQLPFQQGNPQPSQTAGNNSGILSSQVNANSQQQPPPPQPSPPPAQPQQASQQFRQPNENSNSSGVRRGLQATIQSRNK